jgi:hypothetical protein
MKTVRLVFNNADATPKSNVLDIHFSGVKNVCQWYAAFCAGDRFTVTLNGLDLPLDLNGVPDWDKAILAAIPKEVLAKIKGW